MQAFWRRSILLRAAAQVVGIALVVGLGLVLLTVYLTERYTQESVSRRIRELMTTVESTVQIACFAKDPALALEVVNGLAKNSEVFAAIVVGGSETLAERRKEGYTPGRAQLARAGRVVMPIASPFDAAQIVGEIAIDPDPEIVSSRVRENGAYVALLLGAQLLVAVGAVAAVVLLSIVRPIKRMSDRLHLMDARSIEALEVPRGLENTEIGRLVEDVNQLGQRLAASLDEEHRLVVEREVGERKYRAIFENADSGIFVVDPAMRLGSCNHAFFRQLDLPRAPENGDPPDLLKLPWRDPQALARLLERCAAQNRLVSDDFEYVARAEPEAVRWFTVTLTPVGDGLIQGQLTDISRHKLAELSAQQEAVTDSLTGLLNRNGFLQKIDAEVAAGACDDAGFALLLVDLDGFRRVNESMGLASGDRILNITASRLRSCVKGSDAISRLANDAFGIILHATSNERAAAGVAMRVSVALKGFYDVGSTPLQLGASIGIALFPADGTDRETLLRNAEMALEQARIGGGRYCFFDVTMARNAEFRRKLENDLHFAVRRNELVIHFQPIIDLAQRRMTGVEALVRWKHPEQGLVPPDVFIPLAEETGAIINIGLWVVETVCQQLATWRRQGADYTVSLNISARQIPDGLPPITLIETVNRYGVDPAHLAIEITESVFMGNSDAAQTWLDAVHELGFRVYLDDFGTGFSSLSYIKRFPVDVLKVDKSFIRDMSEDNSDRALVGAIINMAGSLGLSVVAEGVETERQLELLERAGCHCVQGYYFSRPVPADEIGDACLRIPKLL